MKLHELFVALGEESFRGQLRGISLGTLKTYKFYERLRVRLRVAKLNTEALRLAAPKAFARLQEGDEDLALEISQCILISNMKLIIDVLNFLGVPHNDGFFAEGANPAEHLTGDWQARAYSEFKEKCSEPVLLLYLNYLAHEINAESPVFQPA
ncbi:MAG: hypothetical protein NW208_12630 [Bryobacter sp.]|nr:hypothetical protein [Bryobacter sp.]